MGRVAIERDGWLWTTRESRTQNAAGRTPRSRQLSYGPDVASTMERAIDALSDPDVSIADALRRLLVVARRIEADDLAEWIKQELGGFSKDVESPDYRDGSSCLIAVRFDGYGGAFQTRRMSAVELPPELNGVLKGFRLGMPIAEIDALANGDGDTDPQMQLPAQWLQRFRDLAAEDRVPHMPLFTANHAAIVVPRTYLRGLLDRVKTVALDLALDIEDAAPDAGDSGGPTVDTEPALREAVASHMTLIFASNSNVSVASGAGSVAMQLQVGDLEGFLAVARTILDEDGVSDLEAALREDGGEPGDATRGFLDRVRSGAYGLVGGLAVNGAYDGLMTMLGQVFPGFS